MKKRVNIIFSRKMAYGVADALDRLGITVCSLCLIGCFFTEQISMALGVYGVLGGGATSLLGIYNKIATTANEGDA